MYKNTMEVRVVADTKVQKIKLLKIWEILEPVDTSEKM